MMDVYRRSRLVVTALLGAAGAAEADAKSVGSLEALSDQDKTRLLEARVEAARGILMKTFSQMLQEGQASKNQLAQWYNWPNWNNWGNYWRNW
jgi:hypothetical protein